MDDCIYVFKHPYLNTSIGFISFQVFENWLENSLCSWLHFNLMFYKRWESLEILSKLYKSIITKREYIMLINIYSAV